MLKFLAVFMGILWFEGVEAEPWVAARLSQNCSGCHSPGRRNLPPVKRRCSLSCQGCHVSPNGGGLRSHYGKWAENHWLKTFRSKMLKQKRTTGSLKEQRYYHSVKSYKNKSAYKKIRKDTKGFKPGRKLVRSKSEYPNEWKYDRKGDPYPYVLPAAKSRSLYEYSMAYEDPYRLMYRSKIDGGGDFRLATVKRNEGDDTAAKSFLMSADFGIRYRPTYKQYHLVYEARILGSPAGRPLDTNVNTEKTRSFYFMRDDLPYNVFVQAGYYRPLFGNYVSDHYALAQVLQGATLGTPVYNLLYKAVSVGTAPNVPYMNLHFIGKNIAAGAEDKTQGLAANIGLRFVSFGASVNYSFWATEDKTNNDFPVKVVMHSLHAAGAIFGTKLLGELEFLSLEKDDVANDFRRGGVTTFALKFRFWRENYLTAEYASSNTNRQLAPGKATQSKVGIKSFIIPGVEYSLQLNNDSEETTGVGSADTSYYLSMVHLYF